MYIAQAFNVLHDWWRYFIGFIIIAAAVVVGQIPFTALVMFKAIEEGDDLANLNEQAMLSMLEPNLNLFLMLLSFAIGLVGIFIAIKALHKQTITHLTTSRPKIDWKRVFFAFFFWGIVSSGLTLLDYFMSPDDYVVNFKLGPFLILCVIAIIMVPLQTSFEEYLFRGYLMQGIGVSTTNRTFPATFMVLLIAVIVYFALPYLIDFKWYFKLLYLLVCLIALVLVNSVFKNSLESEKFDSVFKLFNRNWVPLLVTSAVFGLLHISNPEVKQLGNVIMVYYIGTGLFLGIMTLMDEGMELALGFHAANNLFTALLVTADWTAFQTHSILKDMSNPTEAGFIDVFLPVFVMFPILLFIFSKKYKWTNWKDKLFGTVQEPPKEDYKILE
ncbi:CPBP family glutamic-type intramembrane protease [Gaetbulibacter sp. NE]|uniref:CPBP family glutamic-type intramembrane protease n=1 Tax=Gaetbulibacter sp. NE TaxID=2982307 RepID=UPI0021CE80DA|nr:CPBP family glutamic-type intramembrane protease [Gaetbulibacter sp. NE]